MTYEFGTWYPIESAPKDGTRILVARINEEIGDGDIEISEWCSIKSERYEWVEGDLFRRVNDLLYEFWNDNGHRATHWMPLPPPPAKEE